MNGPHSFAPQMQQATQLQRSGNLQEAERIFQSILQSAPGYHPAYHGLALLAYTAGRLPIAIQLLTKALELSGPQATYLRDRGEMYRQQGDTIAAIQDARQTTKLSPENPDGFYNLGLALADAGRFEEAVTEYRRALSLNERHGFCWNNLGTALEKLEQFNEAKCAYERAVALNPMHLEAQNNLGTILARRGDISGAITCFNFCLEKDPNFIPALHQLTQLQKTTPGSLSAEKLEQLALQLDQLSTENRTKLLFALGKARDDQGLYPQAFAAYKEANARHRATLEDNEQIGIEQSELLLKNYSASYCKAHIHAGNHGYADSTPVFVVGMPRSGTTLIEQIIASHPDAHGAGELKTLHHILQDISPGPRFAERTTKLSPQRISEVGERYIESIRKFAPNAKRIVDKMPGNFFYLGVIAQALPEAKIIHARRDPMDSCLSNYTRLFNDSMEFAYSLETLGRYYNRYIEIMRHWHQVLPEGFILDSQYETMVNDQEAQSRRIIEHIGLDWDPACLEFHKTNREVKTASLAQVRRPIYKDSVSGWKRFEKQLQPLLDIVGKNRDV